MPSLLQPVRLRWIYRVPEFLASCALLGLFTTSALPAPEHRFRPALPGYVYHFPWDLGSHEEFQTEWWYYTGHLLSADQHRYGYQLTFFRRAVASEAIRQNPSRWSMRNIYFAHFAITDEEHDAFRFAEKISREGLGKAGAETGRLAVWIDQWRGGGGGTRPFPPPPHPPPGVGFKINPRQAPPCSWPPRGRPKGGPRREGPPH